VNYISFAPGGYDPRDGADQNEFHGWWPATIIIGKDILIPAHGIYWMIMLHACGFSDADMPRLIVHGWWNIAGAKMSKSEGNVVDPDVLADKYGADALRHYLMSDISTGRDSDFSEERVVGRYNTDLANNLGNLLNRSLNMAGRYRESRVENTEHESVAGIVNAAAAAFMRYSAFGDFEVDVALAAVNEFAGVCNEAIERTAPWKLAKDNANAEQLDAVLYHLAESLRIIAILISPVTPKAAHSIFDQLNWKMEPELRGSEARFSLADAEWGKLPDGHVVGKPTPLFPRIEAAPNSGVRD
jgi:methionyl-tRNA synthetase